MKFNFRANHFRNIPGMAPPMRPIFLDILLIFSIIVCIWKNLFNSMFSPVTVKAGGPGRAGAFAVLDSRTAVPTLLR
jgi:hypothetical protein